MAKNIFDLYLIYLCKREKAQANELSSNFTAALDERAKLEFDSAWANKIKRRSLDNIELAVNDSQKVDAFCAETHFKDSTLSLFYIVVPNITKHLTAILDQSSRGEIKIKAGERDILVKDWVIKQFDLEVTGRTYYCVCTSKFDKYKKGARNIIAAETGIDSITKLQGTIKSEKVTQIFKDDIAQYKGYEIYAAQYGAVYIINKFNKKRLEKEYLLIFIIEIVLLKVSAIQLANSQLTECLEKESNNANEMLEKISKTFAASIDLWDTQHFRYFTAQTLANQIETAFGLPVLLEQYNTNRRLLEQINTARNTIETGKLNKIVAVLATMQVTPILSKVFDCNRTVGEWVSFAATVILLFVALRVILFKGKFKIR